MIQKRWNARLSESASLRSPMSRCAPPSGMATLVLRSSTGLAPPAPARAQTPPRRGPSGPPRPPGSGPPPAPGPYTVPPPAPAAGAYPRPMSARARAPAGRMVMSTVPALRRIVVPAGPPRAPPGPVAGAYPRPYWPGHVRPPGGCCHVRVDPAPCRGLDAGASRLHTRLTITRS